MAKQHQEKHRYFREHIHRNISLDNQEHDSELIANLVAIGKASREDVFARLQTSPLGLTASSAHQRLGSYGLNQIAREKPRPWWWQFIQAFITPFTLILLTLAIVSLFTDVVFAESSDWTKIIIIGTMIILSGGIRFWQEFRSQKAVQALERLVQNKTSVVRQGNPDKKPIDVVVTHLVPGDIVHLSAGDMIPADVRLVASDDLYVSQSALTGEAMPVEKYAALDTAPDNEAEPLEIATLCFTGTTVVSGTAIAVVIATGNQTYLGALAKQVSIQRPLTSFDKGVNGVGMLLVRFMLVMVPIVFFVNGFTKGDWGEAFFFAVAVAVGLTPELLPVVVTANLAKGAIRMGRKKVIIKRLNAIQNFGAMDILCTDKTGTLTENHIVLLRHLDLEGKESDRVLELAYINSSQQTGLNNLLDQALLDYHDTHDPHRRAPEKYTKIDEVPFDFVRRRMSVVVENAKNERLLICKGAVEELLTIATHVEEGKGRIATITKSHHKKLLKLVKEMNADGMRVIAVGYKHLSEHKKTSYHSDDETGMTLVGYIGFLDPAKQSAGEALRALADAGIQTKIITGDNEVVTAKICGDVGFSISGVLLGDHIQNMDDTTLKKQAESANVFAKTDPLQKARIIAALRANGHVVGYMGDGVNDAAAMRQSDVGISVDSGVDIAKESADIILLKHDLSILRDGIIEGRTVFGNIMKYIKMTASSNFGNVFSVLVASAFLPFLPMLPIHLLIQNLLYDFSQISIPWDNMDKEFLDRPRKWEASGIGRFMIFVGPISSLFDIATFLVMWFVFQANNPGDQSLFQSGWFVEGLLSQTLIVHMIRTQRIPFVQSRASRPVLFMTALIVICGVLLPFTPIGLVVGLRPLPLAYLPWLVGILTGYFVFMQVIKTLYIKRFKAWL